MRRGGTAASRGRGPAEVSTNVGTLLKQIVRGCAVGSTGARAIQAIRAGFIEEKWYRGRGSNPHDPKGHRIVSPVVPEPYIENFPVFLALTRDR